MNKTELEIEINNLKEELYHHGVRKKPTMLSAIEEREKEARIQIGKIVMACEDETGRSLQIDTGQSFLDKFPSTHCSKWKESS